MSLDEAFVDLTGCKKLHGPILKTAETIRNEIRDRLGLNASIGIATNKLMAKIASAYCKPNGMLWIAPGSEQQFLAPLPIKRIPGIGPKGCAKLNRMGVKSVADISRLPLELLEETHGKWGVSLYRKARGISCSSRRMPLTEAKQRVNHKRSKVRATVEHIFGFQQNSLGGKFIRTIGILRARTKIGLMNLAYNMKRYVYLTKNKPAHTTG